MKTTEEIFNKCIQLSKASVQLGLDENYELKNCRELWRKQKWYSENEIIYEIKKVQNSNKLFNDFETDFLNILFNTPDLNSMSSDEDSLNKDLTAKQQVVTSNTKRK